MIICTVTVKTTVLIVVLANESGKVNTAHFNSNDMKYNIVGHHIQRDCVNDRNTDSLKTSRIFLRRSPCRWLLWTTISLQLVIVTDTIGSVNRLLPC